MVIVIILYTFLTHAEAAAHLGKLNVMATVIPARPELYAAQVVGHRLTVALVAQYA
jgi:hypothetical protein